MSCDEHLISMAGGDGDSADQLAAIEARAKAADEGPWRVERHDLSLWVHSADEGLEANLGYVGNRPEANATFIANARADVPALIAVAREQQAKLDRVRDLCDAADRYGDYHVIQSDTIRAAITATEEA